GLFVELDESKVSGLVHISQLANDYYHFDATRKLLKGERTGAQFRLGDHVRIQVLRASLEDRKIDFRLVSPRTPVTPPTGSGKAYDYAASGERYSLPKKAAAPVKAQGMFGRAAKAIGRAFGRRDAVVPETPVVSDNPPPRSRAATSHNDGGNRPRRAPASAPAKSAHGQPSRGKRQGQGHAAKAAPTSTPASGGKKRSGRKPKPKGKP
ncbi:MAG TPA: S1 RNA-binding domain-containing protein, partial [Rhodanobacter sp.]